MTTPVESAEIRLIQAAQSGDESAFGLLFERHFEAVYNYAVWTASDPALAEDITQEAFIRGHRSIERLGPPYKFRSWMFRLVHNLYIDHYRVASKRQHKEVTDWMPGDDPNPEHEVLGDEEARRVRRAVNLLPDTQREALILREFNGMDYTEIAEVMDVSVDYVGVLLHRARAKFKDAYSVAVLMEDPLPPCDELGDLLDRFHDEGPLSDVEYQQIQRHLADCPTCQQRRRELIKIASLVPLLPTASIPPGLRETMRQAIQGATVGDGSPGGEGAQGQQPDPTTAQTVTSMPQVAPELAQTQFSQATSAPFKPMVDPAEDPEPAQKGVGMVGPIVALLLVGGLLLMAAVGGGALLLGVGGGDDPQPSATPEELQGGAPLTVCGDDTCEPGEDAENCPADCLFTPAPPTDEPTLAPAATEPGLDAPTDAPQEGQPNEEQPGVGAGEGDAPTATVPFIPSVTPVPPTLTFTPVPPTATDPPRPTLTPTTDVCAGRDTSPPSTCGDGRCFNEDQCNCPADCGSP